MTEVDLHGAAEAAANVGAILREAREARGLSVSDVAQSLKFAPRQLEALENERFDQLPGGTIVRGMVRSYARLLKLEPQPLLESIAGRLAAPDASTLAARYSQPVPFHDGGRRSTVIYFGVSLVVLALGGAVALGWYGERQAPPRVAAPERVEPPSAAPAEAKAAEAQLPATEEAKESAAPAADKPVPPGSHRLVIRCEEESWIEVKDANDRILLSSLNPKGTERVVQARGPLSLVIGNAQHVRVLHNDEPFDLAPHTRLAIARFTLP